MNKLLIALAATLVIATPALAASPVTARVSGGATIHTGPGDRFDVIGTLADGDMIEVDYCTQTDDDSDRGSWIGDAGHTLFPRGAKRFCRIPDVGWVARNQIVGRGLIHVTPPDFSGPGW